MTKAAAVSVQVSDNKTSDSRASDSKSPDNKSSGVKTAELKSADPVAGAARQAGGSRDVSRPGFGRRSGPPLLPSLQNRPRAAPTAANTETKPNKPGGRDQRPRFLGRHAVNTDPGDAGADRRP